MKYDFDSVVERRGSACVKWDAPNPEAVPPGEVITMWVADMDFRTAVVPVLSVCIKAFTEPGDKVVMLTPAYNEGEEWLSELNSYIWDNYLLLRDIFGKELPSCIALTLSE